MLRDYANSTSTPMYINPAMLTNNNPTQNQHHVAGSYTPSPSDILNNRVIRFSEVPLLDARSRFTGQPEKIVSFSTGNVLPPSVADILAHKYRFDDKTTPFEGELTQQLVEISWPGLDEGGHRQKPSLSLQGLAYIIALELRDKRSSGQGSLLDPRYNLRRIALSRIRLVRLEHYGKIWVPIWWIESD